MEPMGAAERSAAPWRDGLIVAALVSVAIALRVWHVRWGLPDFTEEAIPFQLSFAMRSVETGAIDWNPHAFSYPSLGVYVHLFVQQCVFLLGRLAGAWSNAADYQLAAYLDPSRMVLAARGVGVACDALSVVAAWRIGRRDSRAAGVVSALLVACSASLLTTARSIYVDSIMTCLALWALERMLAWHASGHRVTFGGAAALIGLAAGAKYPAAVLLLPLVVLAVTREGRGAWRWALCGAAIAALAFLISSPFVLLDPSEFLRDFSFEGHHAAQGHLGSEGHASYAFHMRNLVRDLGWPACIALVASLGLLLRRAARRPAAWALWLAWIAFALPISIAHIDAERYLLSVIAMSAPLVAMALAAGLQQLPARARFGATAAGLAVLWLMPVVAGVSAARRGARDTQVDARRWCESHVERGQLMVSEGYGPRLPEQGRVDDMRSRPAYRFASAGWKARVDALRCFHVVTLPLVVSGQLDNAVAPPGRAEVRLPVASHASAVTSIYYEPTLFTGADWFVTTGAIRGRFAADARRFPAACRLYALLDHVAPVAARFNPASDASGPEIVIYRIDDRVRAALAAEHAWDPLWWTSIVPTEYRQRASELLATAAHSDASPRATGDRAWPAVDADGLPAPWVRSLLPLYLDHVATFTTTLAEELAMVGHFDDAARVASANHLMMPADVPSCLLASVSLARTQRWPDARAAIERTLRAVGPGPIDPSLELQYARALARTGEKARAHDLERHLIARLPAGDPLAVAAAADLER